MPAQRRENHQKPADSSLVAVSLEKVSSDDGKRRMRQVYDIILRASSSDVGSNEVGDEDDRKASGIPLGLCPKLDDEARGSHQEVGNVRRPRQKGG